MKFFADYSHPQVDGRMQIDGNQLTIEELRIGDTGVYRCTSSGNTIEDEDTIYVFVNGKQYDYHYISTFQTVVIIYYPGNPTHR